MESIFLAFQHIKFMLAISDTRRSIINWSANCFMAVSAILVSFSVDLSGMAIVFLGFLLGHIMWAISAWAMDQRALLALNIGFIPIDLYAMYIRT